MDRTVSPEHQRDVLADLERALQEGAVAAAGGGRPGEERLANGCFVEPSVLTGVEPGMAIWRDEAFGPVLAVTGPDLFDDAVAAVNDSRYGLSAAIFTRAKTVGVYNGS